MKRNLIFVFAFLVSSLWAKEVQVSEALISALIQKESGGDDQAIGDRKRKNKAYGCLQIRKPVCDDVNNRFGTKYRAEDCLGNRELSVEICKKYLSMWSVIGSDEELARIWNGGSRGFKKQGTAGYWASVKKILNKQGATKSLLFFWHPFRYDKFDFVLLAAENGAR